MVNYFELYNLPVSFLPDKAKVKAKFYELSRLYHPDRFVQASDVARTEALQMAALNNDAYKTLNDADKTMAYILTLNNLLQEDEKYNLPSGFLIEMMDLNEAVSDYELQPDDENGQRQAIHALQHQLQQWNDEVLPLIARYTTGDNDIEILKLIKDYYFRKKYLLRIQERIDRFATR